MFLSQKCSFPPAKWRGFILSTFAVLSGAVTAQAAFAANITVASPVNGTSNSSPVWVRAHNVGCNGLAPTAFGFSVDSGATTMGVTPYDVDVTHYSIGSGSHTIHFKAWTSAGICPVVNTTFSVGGSSSTGGGGTPTPSSPSASIPSYARASADLDTSNNWAYEHDAGTPGSSRGSTVFPASVSGYDNAREFYMTYSSNGGERWHNSFGNDGSATHFVMDTYVYVKNPSQMANLELDLNQVMSNGATVIYGTQCSVYSHSWEWTYVSGGPHWHSSNIPCNPTTWAANTWHHIQVAFHRDSNGYVTHDWVNFDGTHSNFSGASGGSAKNLGWARGDLLMNIQMDGHLGSGSITAYFHKTVFYRW
ncbi:MAG: hypothetical protein ACJ71S_08390 [Acidobacteriaceae bacterium]